MMAIATEISRNGSEALLLLAAVGAIMAALRWHRVPRKDFLLAFIIVLVGTALVQVPVYLGGMLGWGWDLVLFSGVARWIQVLGAVLYVRAALADYCNPWGWKLVAAAVALVVWVL